jgi:predicted TIM-barrel fold metal-dependent hydrolase
MWKDNPGWSSAASSTATRTPRSSWDTWGNSFPSSSEYFRTNFAITTTGVFSIDYPFEPTEQAVQFIRTAPLAPADQERVAHVNAERILRLNQ